MTYDLHIHSCLSPCGDNDMTPYNIANMAALKGLDVIAVADHNSCGNLPAVKVACEQSGVLLVPAMELCTAEEVHVLCYFDALDKAMVFSKYIYGTLPDIKNRAETFGDQIYMGENDLETGREPRLLITASSVSIEELVSLGERYGFLPIPAHYDKASNSVLSNLGFVNPDWGFKGYEVLFGDISPEGFMLKSSDAHILSDIKEGLQSLSLPTDFISHFGGIFSD